MLLKSGVEELEGTFGTTKSAGIRMKFHVRANGDLFAFPSRIYISTQDFTCSKLYAINET